MILFSILILSILYLVTGIKWYQAWYEGAFKTSNAIREVSRYQYFEQSNFLTLGPSSKLTWQPLWPQSLPCTCLPTPLPPFPAWSSCIDCIDILYYRVRITVGHRRIYGEFLYCARSKENPQICFIWCFLMKRMRTLPGTAQVAPASQPSRSLSEKKFLHFIIRARTIYQFQLTHSHIATWWVSVDTVLWLAAPSWTMDIYLVGHNLNASYDPWPTV